jgi:hypothetical protein
LLPITSCYPYVSRRIEARRQLDDNLSGVKGASWSRHRLCKARPLCAETRYEG